MWGAPTILKVTVPRFLSPAMARICERQNAVAMAPSQNRLGMLCDGTAGSTMD